MHTYEVFREMKIFCQNLKAGMTKAEALRQAKIKLLSSRGKFTTEQEFSFAQPYLWRRLCWWVIGISNSLNLIVDIYRKFFYL